MSKEDAHLPRKAICIDRHTLVQRVRECRTGQERKYQPDRGSIMMLPADAADSYHVQGEALPSPNLGEEITTDQDVAILDAEGNEVARIVFRPQKPVRNSRGVAHIYILADRVRLVETAEIE